jgi:hypothetical protein
VGEWQAKLGDQPFHGYYTAILVQESSQTKIMEETVTVPALDRFVALWRKRVLQSLIDKGNCRRWDVNAKRLPVL